MFASLNPSNHEVDKGENLVETWERVVVTSGNDIHVMPEIREPGYRKINVTCDISADNRTYRRNLYSGQLIAVPIPLVE